MSWGESCQWFWVARLRHPIKTEEKEMQTFNVIYYSGSGVVASLHVQQRIVMSTKIIQLLKTINTIEISFLRLSLIPLFVFIIKNKHF